MSGNLPKIVRTAWAIGCNSSAAMQEVVGSTLKGALLALPICCFGFGKSSLRSHPFILTCMFIQKVKKLKQTPPKISKLKATLLKDQRHIG
jgi:hypothetical protein